MAVTRRAGVAALESSKYDPPCELLAACWCSRCRIWSSSSSFSFWSWFNCTVISFSRALKFFISSSLAFSSASRALKLSCWSAIWTCRDRMGFQPSPGTRLVDPFSDRGLGLLGCCCGCLPSSTGPFPPSISAFEPPAAPAAWGSLAGEELEASWYVSFSSFTTKSAMTESEGALVSNELIQDSLAPLPWSHGFPSNVSTTSGSLNGPGFKPPAARELFSSTSRFLSLAPDVSVTDNPYSELKWHDQTPFICQAALSPLAQQLPKASRLSLINSKLSSPSSPVARITKCLQMTPNMHAKILNVSPSWLHKRLWGFLHFYVKLYCLSP